MDITVVYFVYGLAFFGMGFAIALEAGRSPLLAEAQVLRPLAVFGLIHGMHEWFEIFIIQAKYFGVEIPLAWLWLRLGLLVISFISLVAYGVQALRPPKRLVAMDISMGGGLLALYIALFVLTGAIFWQDVHEWILRADIFARYMLAVPGAVLAFIVLRRQAQLSRVTEREKLSRSLFWASAGFLLYGVSQFFVMPVDIFPANIINVAWFVSIFHIPIQVFRAAIAALITISLIRATQIVEKERQNQLVMAQEARLKALQQVQEELVKREALRKELLRHTVDAQEDERARISRELHDETAQILTAFTLDLAALRSYVPKSDNVHQIMDRLQALSWQMAQGIYRLVHDLRPAQLDDLGLIPALELLGDDYNLRMGLNVETKVFGEQVRLDPIIETVCFRVAQEALTNIVRHAKTDQAEIEMTFKADRVILIILDRGVGFDFEAVSSDRMGLGIAGMRERVRSVDGNFRLDSRVEEGTSIEITIPKISNLSQVEVEKL